MSKSMTLGQLIAEGNFDARKAENAIWFFEADEIEELLYNRSYGDFDQQNSHVEAFDAKETLTRVSINTWICTDQLVGFELLVLNGTPIGTIWQSGRKSSRDIAFLSAEARELLADAWERHRPESNNIRNLINPDVLSMPVAAAEDEPFDIDATSACNASLSAYGVAQWMESLENEGGLSAVSETAPLEHAKKTLLREISNDEKSRDRFKEYLNARKDSLLKTEDEYLKEISGKIDAMQNKMLPKIQRRLDELA